MGKGSKVKGYIGEKQLADLLHDFYGYPVRRGQVFNGEPDLVGMLGLHIECKFKKTVSITGALAQSIIASEKHHDGLPVVMFKEISVQKRNLPWLVALRYEDYIAIADKDDSEADVRLHFKGGIYGRMATCEKEALRFYREPYDIICMTLEDFIGIYGNWKLPFTEDDHDNV